VWYAAAIRLANVFCAPATLAMCRRPLAESLACTPTEYPATPDNE
jgi:hypothetical protein